MLNPEELREDGDWLCTDPDTDQFVQRLGPYEFKVFEAQASGPNQLNIFDISEMTVQELEETIDGYYDDLTELTSISKSWPMTIAEILSEKQADAVHLDQQRLSLMANPRRSKSKDWSMPV